MENEGWENKLNGTGGHENETWSVVREFIAKL